MTLLPRLGSSGILKGRHQMFIGGTSNVQLILNISELAKRIISVCSAGLFQSASRAFDIDRNAESSISLVDSIFCFLLSLVVDSGRLLGEKARLCLHIVVSGAARNPANAYCGPISKVR